MPNVMKKLVIFFLVAVVSLTALGPEAYGAAGKKLNILTINLMLINPYLVSIREFRHGLAESGRHPGVVCSAAGSCWIPWILSSARKGMAVS